MALTPDQVKQLVELLKEQARQQQEINSGIDGYLEGLKKAKAIQETINANRKIESDLLKQTKKGTQAERDIAQQKLDLLKQQTDELEEQGVILRKNLAEANKLKMSFAAIGASALKGFNKLPNLIDGSFGKLKSFGLFEMDKAIKQSALDMGKFGSNAKALSTSIRDTATVTNQWGMGVQELAKMQSAFSDELGRTVMMGNEGLEAVSAMAAATGLGVEGAAKLTAEMDNQGLSAKRTADYMEQTMNDTAKMGLNASKVVKNIQNNMKMLNKYNFKGGVKGLAKMAQTTSKLGVDMNFVAGMADKLFDIEGAVDMSAQLQVMGGEWAELADPFKLMYMARNDMEGLTEAMGHAAASAAHFNDKTGEFEISSLEMHKLRKIAEQTGVSYEELATAGKNAAKFSRIKSQIGFSMGTGKENEEMKEFLMNTAQLDENGKAFIIDMKGDTRLLSELGAGGDTLIKAEMANQATLKDRAKAAQSFDEKITNLINMVKTTMLPIIDGIDEVLGPLVENMFSKDSIKAFEELGREIGGFVKSGLEMIKPLAEMALNLGPKGLLYTFLGTKALSWFADKATWFSNGLLLAQGFNMASSGKGGFLSSMGTMLTSGLSKVGGGSALKGAAMAGGAGIAGAGLDMLTDATTDPGSGWNIAGKAASGALSGAAMGAFLGPIGAGVGALIGGLVGGVSAYNSRPQEGQHDALFGSPIHDGLALGKDLGSDFSKNRGIIQGGKITPIDNKDDLLAMKPGGAVDKTLKDAQPKVMKIDFGEIHFKFDDLIVKAPGTGEQSKVAKDLLNNPHFTRDIARMIHVETEKAVNGGKLKG